MKSSHVCVILLGALICGAVVMSNSWAQPAGAKKAPATSVAVCDVVEIFNDYHRAKDLTGKLSQRRKSIEDEDKKRQAAIEAINLEIEGLKEGSGEYEKRFNEMQRLGIDRKAWLQFQDALALREHHRLTKDMYEEIIAMVTKVAKERGHDIVLYAEHGALRSGNTPELVREIARRRVLYNGEKADITKIVLIRLNRTYGRPG